MGRFTIWSLRKCTPILMESREATIKNRALSYTEDSQPTLTSHTSPEKVRCFTFLLTCSILQWDDPKYIGIVTAFGRDDRDLFSDSGRHFTNRLHVQNCSRAHPASFVISDGTHFPGTESTQLEIHPPTSV